LPRHLWQEVNVADLANTALNTQPVGAGPWRYAVSAQVAPQGGQIPPGDVEATPAAGSPPPSGVMLEPNPNRPNRQGAIKRLWLRSYPTFEAALAALRSGEAHGLGHIPQDRVQQLASIPGVQMHTQTLARLAVLLLNTRSPLLSDARTRRAIELAINRSALVRRGFQDQARVADNPIPAQSWAYSIGARHDDYSPADARRLLDEAGWLIGTGGVRRNSKGEPLSLILTVNKDVPSNTDVAREIQAQLSAAGIEIKLALVSRERLLRDYLAPGSFHMALVNWEAQGADPDVYGYWHSAQPGVPTLSFSGWANPKADQALEAAHAGSDRGARMAQYADFLEAFKQDVPAVVLYSPLYVYATRSPAAGVALPPTDMLGAAYRFDTISGWYLGTGR
jgi:peptide/nickel transport system substrate-binding protein